jgi:HSP20 family molecular chaperone IbpA
MIPLHAVGARPKPPAGASLYETPAEYVVRLDVGDFREEELSVEALGPRVTVRADQIEEADDARTPFRLHERLETSFRLPDDADWNLTQALHKHGTLEIHAPKAWVGPRVVPIDHPGFRINPDAGGC